MYKTTQNAGLKKYTHCCDNIVFKGKSQDGKKNMEDNKTSSRCLFTHLQNSYLIIILESWKDHNTSLIGIGLGTFSGPTISNLFPTFLLSYANQLLAVSSYFSDTILESIFVPKMWKYCYNTGARNCRKKWRREYCKYEQEFRQLFVLI